MFDPNTHRLTDDFSQIRDEAGLRWWINQRTGRRLCLVVAGGADEPDDDPDDKPDDEDEDEETEDEDDEEDEDEKKSKKPKEKSISQSEVTKIMAREKRQGKEAGKRELMKQLGIDDPEELKTILEERRAAEDAKLSEAEKAKRDAARATREAEAAKRDAANERFAARIERRLSRAGCTEDDVEDAAKLIPLSIDDEPDEEDIKDAIKALKKRRPEMFGENSKKEPRNSDPGSGPRSKGKLAPKDAAASLLAQRHGKKEPAETKS